MPHALQLHTQQALARYLQQEISQRGEALTDLCTDLQLHPDLLREVLQGRTSLTPGLCAGLARRWEVSAGLLWHWQQDILWQAQHLTPASA